MAASTSTSSAAKPSNSSSSSSQPVPTLYVNNIPLSIKKDELRRQLYALFTPYGTVIDVVACKGVGKHGQAFVVFKEQAAATSAMRALVGEEFYGKSLQITYARSVSKATKALQEDPEAVYASEAAAAAKKKAQSGDGVVKKVVTSRAQDEFESLEKERMAHEEEEGPSVAMAAGEKRTQEDGQQDGREVKRRRVEEEDEEEEMEMEMDEDDDDDEEQRGPRATTKGSSVLLVSSIPAEAGQDALKALFQQHPGFRSLDLLPIEATPTRSASVAFSTAQQAEAAQVALDGFELMKGSGQAMRVVVVPAEAL